MLKFLFLISLQFWCAECRPRPYFKLASAIPGAVKLPDQRAESIFTAVLNNLQNLTFLSEDPIFLRCVSPQMIELMHTSLMIVFCHPLSELVELTASPIANFTGYKMAAFFLEKRWTRLDHMKKAKKTFHSLVHESFSVNSIAKNINPLDLQQFFSLFESYLKSDPTFETEFAHFGNSMYGKVFEFMNNSKKQLNALEKIDSETEKVLENRWQEFQTEFPSLSRIREKEKEQSRRMLVQEIFLKSSPATYQELRSKDSQEQEYVLIVEAIFLLSESDAKTRKTAQKLYDEAVLETALLIEKSNYPIGTRDILFEKLQSKFESSIELEDKFMQAKNEVKLQILYLHSTIAALTEGEAPF